MKSQKTYEAALVKLNEYIAEHHMRKSRVREMVLEHACMLPLRFTAEKLEQACAAERISKGTVYNVLDILVKAHILHAIDRQQGRTATLYEIAPGKQIHIQIRCNRCGKVTEIRDKAIDHVIRMHKYFNFEVQRYTVLIYGECKYCLKPKVEGGKSEEVRVKS